MRGKKPVDYKQFDPRWAKKMYSSRGDRRQTMKAAGCAPTAAADVVATLFDPTITPHRMAQLFVEARFRVDGKGTRPTCFHWTAKRHGMKFKRLYTLASVEKALSQSALVVAHMGKGYWTRNGHYIVLWKSEGGAWYACDPGSSTRKKQDARQLKKEAKGFYAFWPQGG